MKKRNDWIRKEDVRKKRKKDRGIVDFIKLMKHFFDALREWIEEMEDPRNASYITYTQSDLICMGILKNVCSIESMHSMNSMFNEDTCIRTLSIMSGNNCLDEMPHCDTLNYYLSKLPPDALSEIRKRMIRKLIRSNLFQEARVQGKYWRIILDGTGLFSFHERHCEHCLKSTYKDADGKERIYYYHKVLEAKLVLGKNLVISIGTEFIENEDENVSKQDCEMNAAKRLLPRIKADFPHLPICIQGDALYETEPFMKICRDYNWKYILTHKDERQPTVGKDYKLLEDVDKICRTNVGKENGNAKCYNGVHTLSEKTETMNLLEYEYMDMQDGEARHFYWNTNIQLSLENIKEMVDVGRGRWSIENTGFNNQKNILYTIEHLNSHDSTAMKNHYLLTQIADILMQLYLKWNPMVREMGQGIKETSSRLLESFRNRTVTDEDVAYIQIRTSMYLE